MIGHGEKLQNLEKGKKIKDRKEGNREKRIAQRSHGMVVPRGSTGTYGKRNPPASGPVVSSRRLGRLGKGKITAGRYGGYSRRLVQLQCTKQCSSYFEIIQQASCGQVRPRANEG